MFKLILNDQNTLFLTTIREIVNVCKVLSNETRIKIVQKSNGNINFTKMKQVVKTSEQMLSRHLRSIVQENLISKLHKTNTKIYVRNYDYILIKL